MEQKIEKEQKLDKILLKIVKDHESTKESKHPEGRLVLHEWVCKATQGDDDLIWAQSPLGIRQPKADKFVALENQGILSNYNVLYFAMTEQ